MHQDDGDKELVTEPGDIDRQQPHCNEKVDHPGQKLGEFGEWGGDTRQKTRHAENEEENAYCSDDSLLEQGVVGDASVPNQCVL